MRGLPPHVLRPGLGRERHHVLHRAMQFTPDPDLIQNQVKQIVQPLLLLEIVRERIVRVVPPDCVHECQLVQPCRAHQSGMRK